jgi:hypothetical protein
VPNGRVEPPQELTIRALRRVQNQLPADPAHKSDFIFRLDAEMGFTKRRNGGQLPEDFDII